MTPDPQNRIQTILGAFTGLLSGYSQCRCRDKIKNMDFRTSLSYGGRVAAETFIFLFSRFPRVCARKYALRIRIQYACAMYLEYNIIYFTCTMYYVLCTAKYMPFACAWACAHIFYFFTMDTAWASVRRLVRVGAIYFACVCVYILFFNIIIYMPKRNDDFFEMFAMQYGRRGWKCYPQMSGGTARKSRKVPPPVQICGIPYQKPPKKSHIIGIMCNNSEKARFRGIVQEN